MANNIDDEEVERLLRGIKILTISLQDEMEGGRSMEDIVGEKENNYEIIPEIIGNKGTMYIYVKEGLKYSVYRKNFNFRVSNYQNVDTFTNRVVDVFNSSGVSHEKDIRSGFIAVSKLWFLFLSKELMDKGLTAKEVEALCLKDPTKSKIDNLNLKLKEIGVDDNEKLFSTEIRSVGGEDICVLKNKKNNSKGRVEGFVENKVTISTLEKEAIKFWTQHSATAITILNNQVEECGDSKLKKRIRAFNERDIMDLINRTYEFKNNKFFSHGLKKRSLDKLNTVTVEEKKQFIRGCLYCLTHKMGDKNKSRDEAVKYLKKNFEKVQEAYDIGKQSRVRGVGENERRDLRNSIDSKFKWVDDYLTSSGLLFENSICGTNNNMADKIFGSIEGGCFELSDEYLDKKWKEVGGVGSSGSNQACFDLIDLNRKIIVECKDYAIDLVRGHNANIQSKCCFLVVCKTRLLAAAEANDVGVVVEYLNHLSDRISFEREFYRTRSYFGFDMTINKFQPVKPYLDSLQANDNTAFKCNTREVWENVANNQKNQRYFPVIDNEKKVTTIVKAGKTDKDETVSDEIRKDMRKRVDGKKTFDYLFIISVDIGLEDSSASAIYDFSKDDTLINEFPLTTYPASLNKNKVYQMVKIPIDKFLPRVVEV